MLEPELLKAHDNGRKDGIVGGLFFVILESAVLSGTGDQIISDRGTSQSYV